MKLRRLWAIMVVWALLFYGFSGWTYAAEDKSNEQRKENHETRKKVIKHIFFITIEGVSSNDLLAAYVPNIKGITTSGVSGSTIGVLPNNTSSFIAALLTGGSPSENGIKPGESQLRLRSLPGVLDSSGRSSVFIDDGREEFNHIVKGIKHLSLDDKPNYNNVDKEIMDRAINYFNKKHPFFVGIILPGTEYAREKYPPLSESVMSTLNKSDEQIGRLMNQLQREGLYDNTLIVVTGSTSSKFKVKENLNSERIMIPVAMTGPGLQTGITSPPARTIDIAPTIALLAGISLSSEADGMVLWNILQPGEGFLKENLLQKRLKELSKAYIDSIKGSYSLNNEKININLEKEKINQEKRNIENLINEKQEEIDKLALKFKIYKMLGAIFLLVALAGYIGEYLFLRKKFLMF